MKTAFARGQYNVKVIFDRKHYIIESLPFIPSNRGYILEENKFYGTNKPIESQKNVKLIDFDTRQVHIWNRRGFLKKEINEGETDWDCWTTESRQRLITSRSMKPCPHEIKNNGICPKHSDPNHTKFFYHHSEYDKDGNLITKNGRVKCKYHSKESKNPCWETLNSDHIKVFYHE